MQRGLAFLAAAFWLALGATATAQTSQSPTSPAQSWPTRTVRIVIPLAAGGGGDVFARLLADELQRKYVQPFVVENRPGGGLNIGARACADTAFDLKKIPPAGARRGSLAFRQPRTSPYIPVAARRRRGPGCRGARPA